MAASLPPGRLEDPRLVTGRGRYVSDWNLPGQAHGVFLRADRAHARIAAVDASAARAAPGVLGVFTGEDAVAAGLQSLPAALAFKGRDESELIRPHRPVLAQDRVRFVGEPVALLVAETSAAAQDALERIAVEYEELPAVTTIAAALAPGAPRVHDEAPGNLVFEWQTGAVEAVREAFARAAKVVALDLDNTRVVGNPMEPRAGLAAWDATGGSWALYACTQGVPVMRGQTAQVFGVPPERIRILAEDVGGGFGVRFNTYPEYCALMLAARTLGRPVKWVGTRSEVFLADEQARDVVSRGEMALDPDGRILGMRYRFAANLGAYLAPTGPFINTLGIVNCISGVYDVPATAVDIRLVLTNTAPMAAYRGAGRPVMSYAIERLADEAAHARGLARDEFRRRNFVPAAKFPYTTANGIAIDCGDFGAVMAKALAAADWAGFEVRRREAAARGRLRGIGLASYIEATGAGFAPSEQVELRWTPEAGLTLYATTHSHGQGHETAFAQVVSAVLGVAPERIGLRTADGTFLVGNATGGSRSLLAVGSLLHLGAHEVVKKARALAAEDLETAEADLEFLDGRFRIRGTDREVTLASLVKKHAPAAGAPHPLDTRFESKFGATFPNGCHVAEVEIDPETGESGILRYIACDDAGNVINHQLVEGQMHGGVTQGAGQVFMEQAVYDRESGQLLTGSFMDYAMPRALLVERISVLGHPVPTAANPLGAKGVGEAGVTGSLPALMNAVLDALRPAGVEAFDMPATPERLWRAIAAARAGQPAALAARFP